MRYAAAAALAGDRTRAPAIAMAMSKATRTGVINPSGVARGGLNSGSSQTESISVIS